MECLACIRVCPTDALELDKSVSCVRLEGRAALRMDEEKCNKCDQCNEICPMGNITLSAEGCSFCIICKSSPNCILPSEARASFSDLVVSIARFTVLMRKFIFL